MSVGCFSTVPIADVQYVSTFQALVEDISEV